MFLEGYVITRAWTHTVRNVVENGSKVGKKPAGKQQKDFGKGREMKKEQQLKQDPAVPCAHCVS